MLDRHDVDTQAQGSCDTLVVGLLIATDPMVHLERIWRGLACRMERDDFAVARRRRQVVGERCDPAVPRRVRGNECSPYDHGPPLGSRPPETGSAGSVRADPPPDHRKYVRPACRRAARRAASPAT